MFTFLTEAIRMLHSMANKPGAHSTISSFNFRDIAEF